MPDISAQNEVDESSLESTDEDGVVWPFPGTPPSNAPVQPPPPVAPPPPVSGPPVISPPAQTPSQLKAELPKTRPRLKNPKFLDEELLAILCWPRCHDSESEKKFGDWLLTKLNKMKVKPTLRAQNCITVEIGKSTTLFSCHIDTCHNAEESAVYGLLYDSAQEHLFLDDSKESKEKPKGKGGAGTQMGFVGNDPGWNWRVRTKGKVATCMGADDGAGVWLMLKMIEAKIPGAYVFHRGEERGGIGSNAMLAKDRDWLKNYKAAVAFDRAGLSDVVTTQGGTKCCSDEYAKALCTALSKPEMAIKYEPSTGGTFTDTKVYIGVIPECVNISVGYYKQHGPEEHLDYGHLYALLDIVKAVKWDDLPIKRDPSISTGYNGSNRYGSGARGGYGGYYGYEGAYHGNDKRMGGDDYDSWPDKKGENKKKRPTLTLMNGKNAIFETLFEELFETMDNADDVEVWLTQDDQMAAKIVMQMIVEGRALEIKYNMLRKKTLEAG